MKLLDFFEAEIASCDSCTESYRSQECKWKNNFPEEHKYALQKQWIQPVVSSHPRGCSVLTPKGDHFHNQLRGDYT